MKHDQQTCDCQRARARRLQAGATFVEFALVAPLVFLMIFFLCEMGRYMFLYSTLNIGADQAIDLAAKIDGLEDTSNGAAFNSAKDAVIARAKAAAQSAMLSTELNTGTSYLTQEPVLTLPAAGAGLSAEQSWSEVPIRIEMQAEIRPILPFFPRLPITIRAEGYRERAKVASVPIPADCVGNPQGSENYNQEPCPCPDGQFWDDTLRTCTCEYPYGSTDTDHCGCPSPAVSETSYPYCSCPREPSAAGCGEHQTVNEEWNDGEVQCSCQCDADHGFVDQGNGTCACPAGKVNNAGTCECTNTCPLGQVRDENNCNCTCPAGSSLNGSGQCVCDNSNYDYNNEHQACECGITAEDCGALSTFSEWSCSCVCRDHATDPDGDGNCACSGSWVLNMDSGRCRCGIAEGSCGENKHLNAEECACQCNEGFELREGACRCPAGRRKEGGVCVCAITDGSCGAHMNVNPYSCGCQCDDGFEPNESGGCGCPEGFTENEGACACVHDECDEGKYLNEYQCRCDCSTPCIGGTQNPGNCSCSCPEGTAYNSSTWTCECSNPGCPSGQHWNAESCRCDCGDGLTRYGDQCVSGECAQAIEDCGADPDSHGECGCDE